MEQEIILNYVVTIRNIFDISFQFVSNVCSSLDFKDFKGGEISLWFNLDSTSVINNFNIMELIIFFFLGVFVSSLIYYITSEPKEISRILVEQGSLKRPDGTRVGIYRTYEVKYDNGKVKLETIES